MEKNDKEKPLTLEALANYNQEILFPFMKETFVTKNEFNEFKDNVVKFQDKTSKDLEALKQEKTMGEEQDRRKKRIFEIHNNALKRGEILSTEEIVEIEKLNVIN